DGDIAQYFCARANHDIVADRGVPFAVFLAGAAQRYTLVQRDIVAHDGGLADDDSHSVVDEKAVANLCAGMDLDAGNQPGELRQGPGRELPAMDPQRSEER